MRHLHRNELSKACFADNAANSDSKNLAIKTIYDKILKEGAYEIAIIPKCDGYQRGLASMVYKFFDKKTESGVRANANKELAQEIRKPVIKKKAGLCKV